MNELPNRILLCVLYLTHGTWTSLGLRTTNPRRANTRAHPRLVFHTFDEETNLTEC